MVALDDKVVEVHGVDLDVTRHVIDLVADAAASGEHNVGLVVCGLKSAYVQRSDKPFLDEVGKYYAALSIVDDLHEVLDFAQEPSAYTPDGDAEIVLKLAILDLDGSERFTNEKLTHLRADYQVVVSGKLWVDIMNIETDKSRASRRCSACSASHPRRRRCSATTSTICSCLRRATGRSPWATRTPI